MAARRESPLTECPVSFCTRNTNFSFAPALAYASEALFAASITPARGVSESESPLIPINSRGDSRIRGCGEVRLHAALRNSNHADAFRIDVIAGLEIIDQPHHIPHGVVKERMFRSGFIGAKDRIIVPALSPLPVIPAVYGYCHKTACRQFAG